MSEQSLPVFRFHRRSHLKSATVHNLARILSLFRDESPCSPATQISLEAPKLGLGTQQEFSNYLADPSGLKPENLSIDSTKAVGIRNESSCSERTVINHLDDRTRPEGYKYLGCRKIPTPSTISVDKDLIPDSGVASVNDHLEHLNLVSGA